MKKTIFINLYSGIEGGRIGLENLGMNCLGFSEINKNTEIIHHEFFRYDEVNYNDDKHNPNQLQKQKTSPRLNLPFKSIRPRPNGWW